MAFCPPWPRVIVSSPTSASSPRERYVSRLDHSSSGCAVTNRIRVVTRDLLMASMVSASDWPVARGLVESAATAAQITTGKVVRHRVIPQPPEMAIAANASLGQGIQGYLLTLPPARQASAFDRLKQKLQSSPLSRLLPERDTTTFEKASALPSIAGEAIAVQMPAQQIG